MDHEFLKREETVAVRVVKDMHVKGKIERGRSKKEAGDVIE